MGRAGELAHPERATSDVVRAHRGPGARGAPERASADPAHVRDVPPSARHLCGAVAASRSGRVSSFLRRHDPRHTRRHKRLRLQVLARDLYRCHWCGSDGRGRALQLDHVVELAQGGAPFDPANCVAACWVCNGARSRAGWVDPPGRGMAAGYGVVASQARALATYSGRRVGRMASSTAYAPHSATTGPYAPRRGELRLVVSSSSTSQRTQRHEPFFRPAPDAPAPLAALSPQSGPMLAGDYSRRPPRRRGSHAGG
jgi:5-methylcytosine-specific restriction endonuclease McrA